MQYSFLLGKTVSLKSWTQELLDKSPFKTSSKQDRKTWFRFCGEMLHQSKVKKWNHMKPMLKPCICSQCHAHFIHVWTSTTCSGHNAVTKCMCIQTYKVCTWSFNDIPIWVLSCYNAITCDDIISSEKEDAKVISATQKLLAGLGGAGSIYIYNFIYMCIYIYICIVELKTM